MRCHNLKRPNRIFKMKQKANWKYRTGDITEMHFISTNVKKANDDYDHCGVADHSTQPKKTYRPLVDE